MENKHFAKLTYCSIVSVLLLLGVPHINSLSAQTTLPTTPQRDTAQNKTNTNAWKNIDAVIHYETLHNRLPLQPDTLLHSFQRRPFIGVWGRDLGNPGSPINHLFFQPEDRVGPNLGYHVYDDYRFAQDRIGYYNTTRPYSEFTYQLGSKLEQIAGLLHTQNIKPNWNFMARYQKITAPGFYKIQRNNHDNFCFTTNYKSLSQHYELYAGIVYNKEQHDENGGIVNDSQLTDAAYTDRRTVDVAYQNSIYSISRSTVTNVLRDFSFSIKQGYTWGKTDTTYNADSTEATWKLVPKFSVTHRINIGSERHSYKDLAPDSFRYLPFFNASFPQSTRTFYILGGDSVFTRQEWFWVDNEVMLNGFAGRGSKQVTFSAGVGSRVDRFTSSPLVNGAEARLGVISNYVSGSVAKAQSDTGKWDIQVNGRFYFSGDYAGNFKVDAHVSKKVLKGVAQFSANLQQSLGSATYNYTHYQNAYTNTVSNFDKESQTVFHATLDVPKLRLKSGFRNTVIGNYLYTNAAQLPAQYKGAFSINSVWLSKTFKLGNFYIDNEWVYQQLAINVPINVPAIIGRHQFSYDRDAFKRRIKLSTGFDVRYHSAYHVAGYSAVLNRFYYQQSAYVANFPELSVFFNFRVRHFRAFFMIDQLQQAFTKNAVLFTAPSVNNFYSDGIARTPVFAAQNVMFRFGFNWVLLN